jgi:hypothetical protein
MGAVSFTDLSILFFFLLFVKQDLKGVMKCIGVEIWTPSHTYRDRHNTETKLIPLFRLVTSNNNYIVFYILIPQRLR